MPWHMNHEYGLCVSIYRTITIAEMVYTVSSLNTQLKQNIRNSLNMTKYVPISLLCTNSFSKVMRDIRKLHFLFTRTLTYWMSVHGWFKFCYIIFPSQAKIYQPHRFMVVIFIYLEYFKETFVELMQLLKLSFRLVKSRLWKSKWRRSDEGVQNRSALVLTNINCVVWVYGFRKKGS